MGRLGEICHAKRSKTTAGAARSHERDDRRCRHHRLRRHQRRLPEGRPPLSADRGAGPRRSRPRAGKGAQRRVRAARPHGDRAARRSCRGHRAQPHHAGRPPAGRAAGDRRRQARLWREAACGLDGAEARAHARGGRCRAACASAARPTPSSAAATRARGACSTMARSAPRSAAPPFSCWQATSAGIRTPTSTTPARAAGRCSTWAPTTSPIWSSCSGRSPRSWPSARSAARAA